MRLVEHALVHRPAARGSAASCARRSPRGLVYSRPGLKTPGDQNSPSAAGEWPSAAPAGRKGARRLVLQSRAWRGHPRRRRLRGLGARSQRCADQRSAPPHSTSCSPCSFSSGAVDGTGGAPEAHQAVAVGKHRVGGAGKEFVALVAQPKPELACAGLGDGPPPNWAAVILTALLAPARRTSKAPSHQGRGSMGKGWLAQVFIKRRASGWSASKRRGQVLAGRGTT